MHRTWTDVVGIKVRCMSWSLEYNEHHLYHEAPSTYYNDLEDSIDIELPIIALRIYYISSVGFMQFYSNTMQDMQEQIREAAVEINAMDYD